MQKRSDLNTGPPRPDLVAPQEISDAPTLGGLQTGDAPTSNDWELPCGSRLGRYVVLGILGRGGMGTVYKAYDPELDRPIAIKLVTLPKKSRKPEKNQRARIRLLREAQALAKLSHPNVVAVHDVGTLGDGVFVAMELVSGVTLRQWLKDTERPWRETLRVLVAAGRGLAAAHDLRIVHRDFKPTNVMIGNDGRVYVIDFGLVRGRGPNTGSTDDARSGDAEPDRSEDEEASGVEVVESSAVSTGAGSRRSFLDEPLTRFGAVIGTPLYMAPEQHVGERADERSDQFSFAVVLYEALYGQHPYGDRDEQQLLALEAFKGKVRPPPEGSKVPSWIHRVVLRGLSVEAEKRFATLSAMLGALERDPRLRLRRSGALGAFAAAVAVAGWGLWTGLVANRHHCTDSTPRLTGVWDRATAGAVRGAFLASGLTYAQESYRRVAEVLDQYTRDWVGMANRACEATFVTHTQTERLLDLRSVCLEDRLQDLGALVRVFRQADKGVVDHAVQAATKLGPLKTCADVKQLVSQAETQPPPRDETTKALVEALRAELSEARALESSGKYEQALAKAGAIALRAKTLQYDPLLSDALCFLGILQERMYQLEEAQETLTQGWSHAELGRNDDARVRCGNLLVWLLGYDQNHFDEAIRVGRMTRAVLDRMSGSNDALWIQWYNMMGSTLMNKGDLDHARQHYEKSLEMARKAFGPESISVGVASNNLGLVSMTLGDYPRALSYFQRDVEITGKLLGQTHPGVLTAKSNIVNTHLLLGELGPAEALLAQISGQARRTLEPDHLIISINTALAGWLLSEKEEWDRAIPILRQALAMQEKKLGAENSITCNTRLNLGQALMEVGQSKEAEQTLRAALSLMEKSSAVDNVALATHLNSLGELEQRMHNRGAATKHFQRTLQILEKRPAPHPEGAVAHLGLGLLALERNLAEQAETEFAQAGSICARASCSPFLRARLGFAQARAGWPRPARREGALAQARSARSTLAQSGVPKALLGQIDQWIREREGGPAPQARSRQP